MTIYTSPADWASVPTRTTGPKKVTSYTSKDPNKVTRKHTNRNPTSKKVGKFSEMQ